MKLSYIAEPSNWVILHDRLLSFSIGGVSLSLAKCPDFRQHSMRQNEKRVVQKIGLLYPPHNPRLCRGVANESHKEIQSEHFGKCLSLHIEGSSARAASDRGEKSAEELDVVMEMHSHFPTVCDRIQEQFFKT
jgi:hypothetical protein